MEVQVKFPGLPGFGYVPLAADPDVRVPPAWAIEATDPDPDPLPTLTVAVVVRDGQVRVESVTLRAQDGGREVTPDDLRRIRLADWTEDAVAAVAMHVVHRDDGTEETYGPSGTDTAARTRAVKAYRASRAPRRRSPITDEQLRKVADVYDAHRDHNPTQAVMEQLNYRSKRTAQLWVKRAEDRGFLTRDTGKGQGR